MFKRSAVSALFSLVFLFSSYSFASQQFPKGPDANLTPGSLCSHPDAYRYPERINYCERDVSSGEKRQIFADYDQLGFRTRSMNRGDFKIDHYIPLCAGGSNDSSNLWPQHKSIYMMTDDLEGLLCEKMKDGSLKQREAVELIKRAKNNLDEVSEILEYVQSL